MPPRCLEDVFKICLQDISSRHVFKTSWRTTNACWVHILQKNHCFLWHTLDQNYLIHFHWIQLTQNNCLKVTYIWTLSWKGLILSTKILLPVILKCNLVLFKCLCGLIFLEWSINRMLQSLHNCIKKLLTSFAFVI